MLKNFAQPTRKLKFLDINHNIGNNRNMSKKLPEIGMLFNGYSSQGSLLIILDKGILEDLVDKYNYSMLSKDNPKDEAVVVWSLTDNCVYDILTAIREENQGMLCALGEDFP